MLLQGLGAEGCRGTALPSPEGVACSSRSLGAAGTLQAHLPRARVLAVRAAGGPDLPSARRTHTALRSPGSPFGGMWPLRSPSPSGSLPVSCFHRSKIHGHKTQHRTTPQAPGSAASPTVQRRRRLPPERPVFPNGSSVPLKHSRTPLPGLCFVFTGLTLGVGSASRIRRGLSSCDWFLSRSAASLGSTLQRGSEPCRGRNPPSEAAGMDGAGVSGLTWLLPPEGKVWCRVFVTLGWEWCLVSRDAPCLRDAHVGCPPQTL